MRDLIYEATLLHRGEVAAWERLGVFAEVGEEVPRDLRTTWAGDDGTTAIVPVSIASGWT